MIKLENVSFQYSGSDHGALEALSLHILPGECVLLCGESGCGKTTVTRLINGLIPHYYEGELKGEAYVNGLNVTREELYETARVVGSVFQNPRSQFFCVDAASEVAFGCENMGLPEEEVNRRVSGAAVELGVAQLLGRSIFELSGGEKQKVACVSVAAMQPEVFVLDEPTSNLDQDAIGELRRTLLLWKKKGKTIVIAEHRLYWLRGLCDRVIYMERGQITMDMPMSDFVRLSPDKIASLGLRTLAPERESVSFRGFRGQGVLTLQGFHFSYGQVEALSLDEVSLPVGGVIAVIGHNGAGKSTFSKCLCGLEKKFKGKAVFDGLACDRKHMLRKSYMVMQDVNHQLFCESVDEEVRLGMDEENREDVGSVLSGLDLCDLSQRHPLSLSGGQKQRVAIASAVLAGKEILVFDEPTSGLDYRHMEQTAALLQSLRGSKTSFIITHDPELIVRCCTHILHLEKGKVRELYPLAPEHKDRFFSYFTDTACV